MVAGGEAATVQLLQVLNEVVNGGGVQVLADDQRRVDAADRLDVSTRHAVDGKRLENGLVHLLGGIERVAVHEVNALHLLLAQLPHAAQRQRLRIELPLVEDLQPRLHVLLAQQVDDVALRHEEEKAPLHEEEGERLGVAVSTDQEERETEPKNLHRELLALVLQVEHAQIVVAPLRVMHHHVLVEREHRLDGVGEGVRVALALGREAHQRAVPRHQALAVEQAPALRRHARAVQWSEGDGRLGVCRESEGAEGIGTGGVDGAGGVGRRGDEEEGNGGGEGGREGRKSHLFGPVNVALVVRRR